VAFCRVSYRDTEGIEHAVEVEGESLYEAVARAVNRFRRDDGGWCMDRPGSACQLSVKMLKDAPITYTVPLKKVVDFALHGTVKGPSGILRKKRIKELLGLN
jgi:hypothetical protein